MQKTIAVLVAVWLVAGVARAFGADNAELKVSRVALFSSGVGYFERQATISGSTSTEFKFRAQQINDILKSLIVHLPVRDRLFGLGLYRPGHISIVSRFVL